LRIAKDQDMGLLHCEANPSRFSTVVNLGKDGQIPLTHRFLKAFQAWPTWRPDAPAEAWLHRIAINLAVSHQRKQRLREVGELVRRLGRPGPGRDPGLEAERTDLVQALRRLPGR